MRTYMKSGMYRHREARSHLSTTIRVKDKELMEQHPEIVASQVLDEAFDNLRVAYGLGQSADPRWKLEVRKVIAERGAAGLLTGADDVARITATMKERWPETTEPPAGATS